MITWPRTLNKLDEKPELPTPFRLKWNLVKEYVNLPLLEHVLAIRHGPETTSAAHPQLQESEQAEKAA